MMKLKTRFENFILNTLPRWLMYIASVLLCVVVVAQIGIWEGRKMERQEISNELRVMGNELRAAEEKQAEMEKKSKYFRVKTREVVATAYCNSSICINVPEWRDGKTATGTVARYGVIAVDPAVIPLGSLVHIKDMGWFRAEDTGGKIKGNRIDIFMGDYERARRFGRRAVRVTFIAPLRKIFTDTNY